VPRLERNHDHPCSDRRPLLREKARADYLEAERDLFQRWGASAVRLVDNDDRRLLARLGKEVGWKRLRRVAQIAGVKTIRRWYRILIGPLRAKSGGKSQTTPEIEALVVKIALDNDHGNDAWGRRRIAGELATLGIDLDSSTVRNILRRHGIPPAPKRGRGRDNDLKVLADKPADVAIDFAHTVVMDGDRICHLYILLAIHIPTREATVVGITEHPTAAFMTQCARNMTMADEGFLTRHRAKSIRMDRDTIFTPQFRAMLAATDLEVQRLPPRMPWENGHIERFVQTIKNLVLRKVFCQSVEALREALMVGLQHDNGHRPHQSLGNLPLTPATAPPDITKPIIRIDHLDGAIHQYVRTA